MYVVSDINITGDKYKIYHFHLTREGGTRRKKQNSTKNGEDHSLRHQIILQHRLPSKTAQIRGQRLHRFN